MSSRPGLDYELLLHRGRALVGLAMMHSTPANETNGKTPVFLSAMDFGASMFEAE